MDRNRSHGDVHGQRREAADLHRPRFGRHSPQSDAAPAFGWAEKLRSEGGKLFATFAHVPDEVRELVAKKHYRHVSMSLMPDRVTLRHVALLGAALPAIDGLRAVEFKNGA